MYCGNGATVRCSQDNRKVAKCKKYQTTTMSGNYRRVTQQEGNAGSDSLDANITRSRGERLIDKLVAGTCCEHALW
jgi:hypothetical protein